MKQQPSPPGLFDVFLRWFCSEELLEEIQGDLHEAFYHRLKKRGAWIARLHFCLDVIRFCRPYSFEKYSSSKQFLPMYKNYITISFRNLAKRKGLTFLNMLGLSLGITSFLLINLYLYNEYTYDQHFPEAERTFRLVNKYRDQTYTCMNFEYYNASDARNQQKLIEFVEGYEEVVKACQFVPNSSPIGPNQSYFLRTKNKQLVVKDLLFTNTGRAFQDIFPQVFIQGSPENAFGSLETIILTEELAERLYGSDWRSQDIVNEVIEVQEQAFSIGGVVNDPPGNIHFDFAAIVHRDLIPSWAGYTYVKLRDARQIDGLIGRLNSDLDLMYPGRSEDELQKGVSAVPLLSIHHTGGMLYELKPLANAGYLSTFMVIGLIILFIIWINHTNLSIAAYANRQPELAVRKAIGARSGDITRQILIEGLLITILCMPIAWLMIYLALPHVNELLEIQLHRSLLQNPLLITSLLTILLLTGMISSLYPAWTFGRKPMSKLFAGKLAQAKTRGLLNVRNGLLIGQFFLVIVALSITLVIQRQMHFIQERDTGFIKEGVVFFNINGIDKYTQLKDKLAQLPEIQAVGTGVVPGQEMYNQLTYKLKNDATVLSDGTHLYTSHGALEALGIQSEALRNLASQDSVMIINRTAARKLAQIMDVPLEHLIGETLIMEPEWQNELFGQGLHYTIAGIIDDFDYFNLHYPSQSLLLEVREEPDYAYNMLLRLSTANLASTIAKIEEAYGRIELETPLELTFLDSYLNNLYEKEQNAGVLTTLLTSISILLATMGLIGVVGFMALARQKEIGIRKVFGARLSDILIAFNKEYVIMIVLATVAAVPITVYLAEKWLQSFAFRIESNFSVVLVSGGLVLLLVIFIVTIQSLRTAKMNPARSLKEE